MLTMTEFGRTARVNGTKGTDHGTASVAFVLGGAVAGGRVAGTWPGLGPGQLFEDRDLRRPPICARWPRGCWCSILGLAPRACCRVPRQLGGGADGGAGSGVRWRGDREPGEGLWAPLSGVVGTATCYENARE